MTEPGSEPPRADPAPLRRLSERITGPIDAFHIVTAPDEEKANEALERLLESDDVEKLILDELVQARPLADRHGFPAAHRTFARALEVYDRNALRAPTGLSVGILRPLATPLVGVMILAISRRYAKRVVRDVRRLYVLREANSPVGTPEHRMLTTARRQLDQVSPDLDKAGFAIPAFLLGGAVLSAVASTLQHLLHSDIGRIALLAFVLLLTIGLFWCIVTAAAATRRRTRLVLDQPLRQLWDTIGAAGRPPRDPSRGFVAIGTILLLVGWVITPVLAAVLYQLT